MSVDTFHQMRAFRCEHLVRVGLAHDQGLETFTAVIDFDPDEEAIPEDDMGTVADGAER